MITTKFLKDIYTEARPIIERHLDDAELLAGMREVVAAQGGDWSSLKALITADVKDGRDEAGDGKRVKKILDKADYSAAYADMLGLANMNDGSFSAREEFDPETGEILEPEPNGVTVAALADHINGHEADRNDSEVGNALKVVTGGESATQDCQQTSESDQRSSAAGSMGTVGRQPVATSEPDENAVGRRDSAERRAPSKPDMEIPAFLRRTKPPPELVE